MEILTTSGSSSTGLGLGFSVTGTGSVVLLFFDGASYTSSISTELLPL